MCGRHKPYVHMHSHAHTQIRIHKKTHYNERQLIFIHMMMRFVFENSKDNNSKVRNMVNKQQKSGYNDERTGFVY